MAAIVVLGVIATAWVAWKIAEAMAKEIGRIYLENAGHGSVARILWYAVGGLFGLWLVCGVVATMAPAMDAACVYTAAWAFLVYVVTIEVVDWQARRRDPKRGDPDSLDTYLRASGQVSGSATGVNSGVGARI